MHDEDFQMDMRYEADEERLYDMGIRYCMDCSDRIHLDDDLMELDGDDLCGVCYEERVAND